MEISQYQIILVNLDPTLGSEIKKTRPCIVISPNEMNKFLNTVVIAPMTTSSKNYPTRIEVRHDNKIGWIVLDQIRTIDKQRIIKDLGRLTKSEINELKSVLKETYIKKKPAHNFSYPQVRQQWFSVGIFPLKLVFGLTGNRPQSAPACSFLRCKQL